MTKFLNNAAVSWKTTLGGVLGFILLNAHQILDLCAYAQGYVTAPGPFNWTAFCSGLVILFMGAASRDADKRSEDHMTGTNSAPQNAALPTSSQAAKILMVIACAILFGLTGCAGSVGNQPPELNAALDGARARQANYKANRDAMDAVEDAALADAQSKAIAQDTQVSVANAQAIAAAKGLPTPELINEIARIYAVSSTENLRVSQNLANLRALRQTFDSDYNSANALIQIVEQANASQPVSATAVLTTSINALSPTIQSLQQSAGVATVPTPTATAVQPVVAAPATIRTTVPSTVALPVPSNVPQPTFSK